MRKNIQNNDWMLVGDKCDIIFGVELKNVIYFEFVFSEKKVLLEIH